MTFHAKRRFSSKALLRQPGGFEGVVLAAVLRVQPNGGDQSVVPYPPPRRMRLWSA